MMAKFKAIKHALHEVEFEMAFYTALILGICSLFLNHKKPALLRAAILTLFLSFSAEFISGRLSPGNSFVYYLLPLSASIPILVWVVFTETQVSFLKDKTAQLIFYLMLSVTLFLGTLRFTSGVRFTETKTEVLTNIPEKEYLKSQHLSDYQLYVLDDSKLVYLYNYFEILAPSPWLYHSFWEWSKDWDADNKIFLSIINDLQLHKTRFILDCSGTRNNIRIRPIYAQWQQFLHTNYRLISKDSSNRELWKIQ